MKKTHTDVFDFNAYIKFIIEMTSRESSVIITVIRSPPREKGGLILCLL